MSSGINKKSPQNSIAAIVVDKSSLRYGDMARIFHQDQGNRVYVLIFPDKSDETFIGPGKVKFYYRYDNYIGKNQDGDFGMGPVSLKRKYLSFGSNTEEQFYRDYAKLFSEIDNPQKT